jgi:circadian clock protein KaiC
LVTLEESAHALERNAASVGIDLDDVHVSDLSVGAEAYGPGEDDDVFSPEDVEAVDVTEQILAEFEALEPDRVLVDPITILRHLMPDPYRFRKQALGLISTIRDHDATLMITSQATSPDVDEGLQCLTDGTIRLDRRGRFRRIDVPKFRGSGTRSGPHTHAITDEGLHVYPVLAPGQGSAPFTGEQAASGVPEIDDLLHGGPERSKATVTSGPTGVGKTTLGTQVMRQAASRGERSSIYLFEETMHTLAARSSVTSLYQA